RGEVGDAQGGGAWGGLVGRFEGVAGPCDDVERVEADRGVGELGEGGFAVDAGHVHAHGPDAGAAVFAEQIVEGGEGGAAAALADPQDAAGVVVGDRGEERAALAVGDLVDADAGEAVEAVVV